MYWTLGNTRKVFWLETRLIEALTSVKITAFQLVLAGTPPILPFLNSEFKMFTNNSSLGIVSGNLHKPSFHTHWLLRSVTVYTLGNAGGHSPIWKRWSTGSREGLVSKVIQLVSSWTRLASQVCPPDVWLLFLVHLRFHTCNWELFKDSTAPFLQGIDGAREVSRARI